MHVFHTKCTILGGVLLGPLLGGQNGVRSVKKWSSFFSLVKRPKASSSLFFSRWKKNLSYSRYFATRSRFKKGRKSTKTYQFIYCLITPPHPPTPPFPHPSRMHTVVRCTPYTTRSVAETLFPRTRAPLWDGHHDPRTRGPSSPEEPRR